VNVFRGSFVPWVAGVLIVASLVASTFLIQDFRQQTTLHEVLYLPSGKLLEQLSLGYRQLAADAVWFSAVQYYGEYRHGNHDLAYFNGLIDIITTLDPNFIFAYIFGAIVVATEIGEFEAGIAILEAGMERNPTSWELPFEIGFLNYVNRVSFDAAARYFDLASRVPNAPGRAKRFAGWLYSKAGDTNSAIQIWREYMEFTDNPHLKELAKRYIEKLEAEEAAKQDRL
jgi:tetratricopeptide (TPR) repeat protein